MTIVKGEKVRKYNDKGEEIHAHPNLDANDNDERLQDILKCGLITTQKMVGKGVPERATIDFIKVLLNIKEHLEADKNPDQTINVNVRNLEEKSTAELLALAEQYAKDIK